MYQVLALAIQSEALRRMSVSVRDTDTRGFGCTDLANDAKCYVVGFGASLEGQTSFDKAVTECGQSKHVSDDVL